MDTMYDFVQQKLIEDAERELMETTIKAEQIKEQIKKEIRRLKDKRMRDSGVTLSPCPFCGKSVAKVTNAAELEECTHFEDEKICPLYETWEECKMKAVICGVSGGGCGAMTGYFTTEEEAVEAWNRREKRNAFD